MTNKRIIVLGDAFVDRWLTIRSTRPSAEQDGLDIYDIGNERQQHGGAANVANALTKIAQNGTIKVDQSHLPPLHERPIKTRLVKQGVQVCRFDINDQLLPIKIPARDWTKDDIVVISDYGKGSINKTVLEAVSASQVGQIWINTKYVQPYYECLDLVGDSGRLYWTCNQAEYEAAKEFYQYCKHVCVTKAEKGIEYRQFGIPYGSATTYNGPVVSVCGAGDVALAALVTSPEGVDRLRWAMAAASVAVGRPFTYCPTYDEVTKVYYNE